MKKQQWRRRRRRCCCCWYCRDLEYHLFVYCWLWRKVIIIYAGDYRGRVSYKITIARDGVTRLSFDIDIDPTWNEFINEALELVSFLAFIVQLTLIFPQYFNFSEWCHVPCSYRYPQEIIKHFKRIITLNEDEEVAFVYLIQRIRLTMCNESNRLTTSVLLHSHSRRRSTRAEHTTFKDIILFFFYNSPQISD